MKGYFLAVFTAALTVSVIGLLSPSGKPDGTQKHLKYICALFLVLVIISPLPTLIYKIEEVDFSFSFLEEVNAEDDEKERQAVLDGISKAYFSSSLTALLEKQFSIEAGDIRCAAEWEEEKDVPSRITVILSGAAVWKDPEEIERFVEELLGCPCDTAIETRRKT